MMFFFSFWYPLSSLVSSLVAGYDRGEVQIFRRPDKRNFDGTIVFQCLGVVQLLKEFLVLLVSFSIVSVTVLFCSVCFELREMSFGLIVEQGFP